MDVSGVPDLSKCEPAVLRFWLAEHKRAARFFVEHDMGESALEQFIKADRICTELAGRGQSDG
jgi:hypothetical protein